MIVIECNEVTHVDKSIFSGDSDSWDSPRLPWLGQVVIKETLFRFLKIIEEEKNSKNVQQGGGKPGAFDEKRLAQVFFILKI